MSILRRHHRRKLLDQPFPDAWLQILHRDVPMIRMLTDAEQQRMREIMMILIDEKYWEGGGGLKVTEYMRVIVASQAAIPLLNLDLTDYYHNVRTFILYPGAYVQNQEHVGSDGLVHSGTTNLGEAWYNGPVILSWQAVEQAARQPGRGENVVFHELAHAVDMLSGMTNGTPSLRSANDYEKWNNIMSQTFDQVRTGYRHGQRDVIRPYGVTNVAEFFAVTTELFFDAPLALQQAHPSVYTQYQSFWGQDPAARWPAPQNHGPTS
ncbi:MAG: zinc-dependent peptidase [Phycisphaerales bacterium]|nr:zinc-dependent peptidase [Phycisphaerales bacterium]